MKALVGRTLLAAALPVVAMVTGLVVGAQAASAAGVCDDPLPDLRCTEYSHGVDLVQVEVAAAAGPVVQGLVSLENPAGEFFDSATVYVQQCRVVAGRVTDCGTIAANRGTRTTVVPTSFKPMPAGHVFRACASWIDHFSQWKVDNQCSPWIVSPT